jgi:hypothetical protein
MGVARLPHGGCLHSHRHDQHEAYLVLDGVGVITIDGTPRTLGPGVAVFIAGNALYSVKATGDPELRSPTLSRRTPLRRSSTYSANSASRVVFGPTRCGVTALRGSGPLGREAGISFEPEEESWQSCCSMLPVVGGDDAGVPRPAPAARRGTPLPGRSVHRRRRSSPSCAPPATLDLRLELPIGPLILRRRRPYARPALVSRGRLRRRAATAGVRRRFAPPATSCPRRRDRHDRGTAHRHPARARHRDLGITSICFNASPTPRSSGAVHAPRGQGAGQRDAAPLIAARERARRAWRRIVASKLGHRAAGP